MSLELAELALPEITSQLDEERVLVRKSFSRCYKKIAMCCLLMFITGVVGMSFNENFSILFVLAILGLLVGLVISGLVQARNLKKFRVRAEEELLIPLAKTVIPQIDSAEFDGLDMNIIHDSRLLIICRPIAQQQHHLNFGGSQSTNAYSYFTESRLQLKGNIQDQAFVFTSLKQRLSEGSYDGTAGIFLSVELNQNIEGHTLIAKDTTAMKGKIGQLFDSYHKWAEENIGDRQSMLFDLSDLETEHAAFNKLFRLASNNESSAKQIAQADGLCAILVALNEHYPHPFGISVHQNRLDVYLQDAEGLSIRHDQLDQNLNDQERWKGLQIELSLAYYIADAVLQTLGTAAKE